MSVILKQHKTDNYYIYVESTIRYGVEVLEVAACPIYGDYCGYPVNNMTYYDDRKNAMATYRRYVKKYVEE